MGILKTVRLVTMVSLAVASGCLVIARQADAQVPDYHYNQRPKRWVMCWEPTSKWDGRLCNVRRVV